MLKSVCDLPILNRQCKMFCTLEIVPATNYVWTKICCYLDWRVSKNALHTFVQQGRHGVKEKLGISSEKCISAISNLCETMSNHTGMHNFK